MDLAWNRKNFQLKKKKKSCTSGALTRAFLRLTPRLAPKPCRPRPRISNKANTSSGHLKKKKKDSERTAREPPSRARPRVSAGSARKAAAHSGAAPPSPRRRAAEPGSGCAQGRRAAVDRAGPGRAGEGRAGAARWPAAAGRAGQCSGAVASPPPRPPRLGRDALAPPWGMVSPGPPPPPPPLPAGARPPPAPLLLLLLLLLLLPRGAAAQKGGCAPGPPGTPVPRPGAGGVRRCRWFLSFGGEGDFTLFVVVLFCSLYFIFPVFLLFVLLIILFHYFNSSYSYFSFNLLSGG